MYAEVILPLPLYGNYTYAVPPEYEGRISVGSRVIVPFGTNYAKTVYIISPHIDIIGEYILKNMNRSGTIIPSRGLFSGENKEMLMTVIPKKDLTKLTRCVKEADPTAFLVIQDTYHVLGEGYQPLDVIAGSKDVSQS